MRIAAAPLRDVARVAALLALLSAPAAANGSASRTFTLEAFRASVTGPPMTVVFDIDDTALYSSFAMIAGETAFRMRHPEVKDPYDDCRLFGAVNDSLDARYSRPKQVAKDLVAFHVSRGDRVVFITKRCASVPPNDSTAHYLARTFGLRELPRVVFTDLGRKVEAFKAEKPAISYGDADSDIVDTIEASKELGGSPIRPVRIVRTSFSSNPGAMNPGKFGEDVIAGSDL
jgi:acid phosphatase (class B)